MSQSDYKSYLKDGVGKMWGYGIHRVSVKANDQYIHKIPYTFTASGFKNHSGVWFTCLRMNVDQCSPQKMRNMDNDIDIHQLWGEMMLEFSDEYFANNRK